MGKSAGSTTSTATSAPLQFVQPSYEKQVGEAGRLYDQPGPSFYPNSTVAQFNPFEIQGQGAALGAANTIGQFGQNTLQPFLTGTMANANQFTPQLQSTLGTLGNTVNNPPSIYGMDMLNQAINLPNNIGNNPGLQAAITGATRPIFQQLTESVLPQLRSDAVGTGTLGGSRQGIAEGLATSKATGQAMDIGAQMQNAAYQNAWQTALAAQQAGQQGQQMNTTNQLNLGQLLGGLNTASQNAGNTAASLTPALSTNTLMPSQIIGAVGSQERSQEQANIDDAVARWNYQQQLPYQKLQEFANAIRGPFGGTETTQVQGVPPDNVTQYMGAIMSLLGILPGIIKPK